jgi:hypothetical protein
MGVADCFKLTPEEVIDALKNGTLDGFALEELEKKKKKR